MDLLSDEVVGAGLRKDDVVTSSMYAWVREAVVLRRGVRRRRVVDAIAHFLGVEMGGR